MRHMLRKQLRRALEKRGYEGDALEAELAGYIERYDNRRRIPPMVAAKVARRSLALKAHRAV